MARGRYERKSEVYLSEEQVKEDRQKGWRVDVWYSIESTSPPGILERLHERQDSSAQGK